MLFLVQIFWFVQACNLFDSPRKDHTCPDTTTVYQNIQPNDRIKVPYQGFDTIRFYHPLTHDTQVFYGIGSLKYFVYGGNLTPDPDCPSVPFKLAYETFKFNNTKDPEPIYFAIYIPGIDYGPRINVNFKQLNYTENTGTFNPKKPYFSKIQIGNKLYDSVYRFGNFNDKIDTSYYIYYNFKQGILKIKLKSGEAYYRVD